MSEELAREFVTLIEEAQRLIPRMEGMFSAESEWHSRAQTAVDRYELEEA